MPSMNSLLKLILNYLTMVDTMFGFLSKNFIFSFTELYSFVLHFIINAHRQILPTPTNKNLNLWIPAFAGTGFAPAKAGVETRF